MAPETLIARLTPPALLAGPLTMLCWAGSIVVVRDVAGVVPPVALSFFRCIVALIILYPLCHRLLRDQWPLIRAHWKLIAFLGALLFIGGNGMLFVGLQFTTAINGALINSAEPVVIIACAWLMFRDRLTALQWVGVVLSMAGVLYLIVRGSPASLLSLRLNIGDLFILVSIVAWAFYAVLLRRVPKELSRLNLVFGILAAGAVSVFPFWLLEHFFIAPAPMIWETAWSVAFNAVFASVLAVFWWNHTIEQLGPGRAGLFVHLIPVYTVFLAMGFLGETLFWYYIVGIGLIGAGIYLTTMLKTGKAGPRRRRFGTP